MLKIIKARFSSKCAETGKPLAKGTMITYDTEARKAYHMHSTKGAEAMAESLTDDSQQDIKTDTEQFYDRVAAGLVQAQEDAYLDSQWERIR